VQNESDLDRMLRLSGILSHGSLSDRLAAVYFLEESRDSWAVGLLIEALKDENFTVRKIVASALGRKGDTRAVEPLIQALKGEVLNHQSWLLGVVPDISKALAKIGDPRAVEPLIQFLNAACPYMIGKYEIFDRGFLPEVKDGLMKIGEPAVEPLIQALAIEYDHSWVVKEEEVEVLSKIGKPAVEPLIRALKDPSQKVRYHAATALGMIGDVEAIGPLTEALQDQDSDVQKAAKEALEKITPPRPP